MFLNFDTYTSLQLSSGFFCNICFNCVKLALQQQDQTVQAQMTAVLLSSGTHSLVCSQWHCLQYFQTLRDYSMAICVLPTFFLYIWVKRKMARTRLDNESMKSMQRLLSTESERRQEKDRRSKQSHIHRKQRRL